MLKTIPNTILDILSLFHQAGYEAVLVGGCVRDFIMQRNLHDYDIATSALPDETIALLEKHQYHYITIGKAHGTICAITSLGQIEITTYRKEDCYLDHRHPAHVVFTTNLQEDLARRDFTMNAIAYDIKQGFIDPYHGYDDIKKKQIKAVGEPTLRFKEDALRILRAARFQCELQFTIEKATKEALIMDTHLLSYVSSERIQAEFNRMLLADYDFTLQLLMDLHILEHILPGYTCIYQHPQPTPWHQYDIFTHTDVALNHTKRMPLILKLAMVLHDWGKVECEHIDKTGRAHYKGHAIVSAKKAKQALLDLHYDNKTIDQVCKLIYYHDHYQKPDKAGLRLFASYFDCDLELTKLGLYIQIADNYGKNLAKVQPELVLLDACLQQFDEMVINDEFITRKQLAINGHDLIAMEIQGKQIKTYLDKAYYHILKYPKDNQKDILLSYLKETMDKTKEA